MGGPPCLVTGLAILLLPPRGGPTGRPLGSPSLSAPRCRRLREVHGLSPAGPETDGVAPSDSWRVCMYNRAKSRGTRRRNRQNRWATRKSTVVATHHFNSSIHSFCPFSLPHQTNTEYVWCLRMRVSIHMHMRWGWRLWLAATLHMTLLLLLAICFCY